MFATVIALAAATCAQPPEPPQFVKDYSTKIPFYYRAPDPKLGPKMLADLLRKENIENPWFARNEHVLDLIGAQLGDIAIGHPKVVREYEAAFAGATATGRRVILRALHNCGDQETLKQVGTWRADPKNGEFANPLGALAKHLEDPKRKHPRDRPAKDPKDLDVLWVNFFTTGEYAPVSRILDVLDLPDEKANEVLKRVAKWSVGSNMAQHPKLVELIREHAKERPAASRQVAEELLAELAKKEKK
jgi:hypothetical protein